MFEENLHTYQSVYFSIITTLHELTRLPLVEQM